MWKIILIILALIYFLNPYDILPDFLVGWGWLDDLVIWGFLGRYLYTQKKKRDAFQKYHRPRGGTSNRDGAETGHDRRFSGGGESGGYSRADDPFKILGVAPGASQEDIKQAYRRLAGKYHPDKVAHLGDEFRTLAEKRFKEIQEAYEKLRRRT